MSDIQKVSDEGKGVAPQFTGWSSIVDPSNTYKMLYSL